MSKDGFFCDNGCPYGAEGLVCFVKDVASCPVNLLYAKVKLYESQGDRCAWCSNASATDPSGRWIAQGHCGECPKYCPACSAPKDK